MPLRIRESDLRRWPRRQTAQPDRRTTSSAARGASRAQPRASRRRGHRRPWRSGSAVLASPRRTRQGGLDYGRPALNRAWVDVPEHRIKEYRAPPEGSSPVVFAITSPKVIRRPLCARSPRPQRRVPYGATQSQYRDAGRYRPSALTPPGRCEPFFGEHDWLPGRGQVQRFR